MRYHFNAQLLAAAVLCALLATTSTHANTIYVNGSCGNDSWQGSDEECIAPTGPYRTIWRAILAAHDGDTILVAPGIYNEVVDFAGKTITLKSTGGRDVTILDGTGLDDSVVLMIDDEGPESVLEGFTVTGGVGRLFHPQLGIRRGGGLYLLNASPTVRMCRFVANSATDGGGAMTRNAAAVFVECTFENNMAEEGGGVHAAPDQTPEPLVQFVNCQFIDNIATDRGGGLLLSGGIVDAPITIAGCMFDGNIAAFGGGVSRQNGSHRYTNCTFQNNTAGLGGAAYSYVFQDDTALTIEQCVFQSNQASGGGAVFLSTDSTIFGEPRNDTYVVSKSDFEGNFASVSGGAVYCDNSGPSISDCHFKSNAADPFLGAGGAVYCANSNTMVMQCSFTDHIAGYGGSLAVEIEGFVTVGACEFEASVARFGAAVSVESDANTLLQECLMMNCRATDGAVTFVRNGSATFNNCDMIDNEASSDGGFIAFDSALTIYGCHVINTGAVQKHAALRIDGATSVLVVENSNFSGHSAGMVIDDGISYTIDDTSITDCVIGGAVYAYPDTVGVIRRCEFIGNGSGSASGAITAATLLIEDSLFEANTGQTGFSSTLAVRGIFPGTLTIRGSTFRNHDFFVNSDVIRGYDDLVVQDCSFENNASHDISIDSGQIEGCNFTGGLQPIRVDSVGTAYIEHCSFSSSQLSDIQTDSFVDIVVRHCVFGSSNSANVGIASRNTASIANCIFDGSGRAVGANDGANLDVTNCLFRGKTWVFAGLDDEELTLRVRNCTLVNNELVFDNTIFLEDSDITAENCIVHQSPVLKNETDQIEISYSLITNGWPGEGNITGDPHFVDPANGDYRLRGISPCIDAGHNYLVSRDVADLDDDGDTGEFVPVDLDGNPRFRDRAATPDTGCGVGPIVDMGAVERQQGPIMQAVFADLDGDGIVGGLDLATLLGAWGACDDSCCLADLDEDGEVAGFDLAMLLGEWSVN